MHMAWIRMAVCAFALATELTNGATSSEQCITSLAAAGRCVDVKTCPRLKRLLDKHTNTNHEINGLQAAYNACPGEQFCCGLLEIEVPTQPPTTTTSPAPPLERHEGDGCLQNSLSDTADFEGASSLVSSFGVFITITQNQRVRCVGSLITPEYVLTAAHCLMSESRSEYMLYVNARHLMQDSMGGLQVDVEPRYVREIIIHERYNSKDQDNDIGLLWLNESVPTGSDALGLPHPICIPPNLEHDAVASPGHSLRCFGWGFNAQGVLSSSKQWVTLERISLHDCRTRLAPVLQRSKAALSERNICTITISGHDAYAGYSGGPLMYQKHGRWYLIGIISYGVGKIANDYPVVSTNVQYYTGWILRNIQHPN